MTIKIVVIGSNPSQASPDNSPFHKNTKSRRVLDSWFTDIDADIVYMNVSNEKTSKNKILKKKQIDDSLAALKINLESLKDRKIVSIGKVAAKVLTSIGISFYEMAHPSGMNRKLNDINYIKRQVEGLRIFLGVEKSNSLMAVKL